MGIRVKVVGNSNLWTKLPCTSFVIEIDDYGQILFDAPMGSTKFMQEANLLDYKKLKNIILTHFHYDHFGDICTVYDNLRFFNPNGKMQLVAPKSAKDRFVNLYKIYDDHDIEEESKKIFCFEEIDNDNVIRLGRYEETDNGTEFIPSDYELLAIHVEHGVTYNFGYVLRNIKTGKSIGFSSDTRDCDGLRGIIELSDTIFIDTANLAPSNTHLSAKEVIEFIKKYPNKKFYSIHARDEVKEQYGDVLDIPQINQVIEFGDEMGNEQQSKKIL